MGTEMNNAMPITTYIHDIMTETAKHLKRSLDVYWPTNTTQLNDLPERNLSAHFSHEMLKRNFHLYAEINNQYKVEKELLDILCISPDKRYHLACEFKTYTNGSMKRSNNDVERVNAFPINTDLPEDIFGNEFISAIKGCHVRVGIVAGILWRKNGDSKHLKGSAQREFEDRVVSLGGSIVDDPILIKEYLPHKNTAATCSWSGAYYLYYAMLGSINSEVDANGHLVKCGSIAATSPKVVIENASLKTGRQDPVPKVDPIPKVVKSPQRLSATGKAIIRSYRDACYGIGINGTVSKCNTARSDKSRLWYATYDSKDNPIWLCSECGCQWARNERRESY